MDKETLMAEAKRRYPEGCKIRCANDNSHSLEDAIVKHSKFNYMSNPLGIHHGNAWIVLKGKWAEIISMKDVEPFTIGGYVRTIVDGDPDKDKSHNTFKKGEIYQIKSIDSDGLVNFDQDGPRLYTRTSNPCGYPQECEWIGMNPHETLPQEESLVEVINNFPIY
jgi:hypothetical protein